MSKRADVESIFINGKSVNELDFFRSTGAADLRKRVDKIRSMGIPILARRIKATDRLHGGHKVSVSEFYVDPDSSAAQTFETFLKCEEIFNSGGGTEEFRKVFARLMACDPTDAKGVECAGHELFRVFFEAGAS